MKKQIHHLLTLGALAAAIPALSASAATVAYWNAPTGGNTLTDLVGGDQNLVGGGGVMTPSGLNIAPLPVPNPDTATTGGSGSIYFNNAESPNLTGASASVFQMTSSSSFTFEGWVQAASSASSRYIGSDRHQGNSYRGWFVALDGSDKLQFYSNSGGTANTVTSTATVADGTAHHFAVVWDHTAGATGQMSLYIDGVLQGSPTDHSVGTYSVYGFSIGGRDGSTSGSSFVDNRLAAGSRLDELRFSSDALSSAQFLNAVPEPGSLALMGLGGLLIASRRRRG